MVGNFISPESLPSGLGEGEPDVLFSFGGSTFARSFDLKLFPVVRLASLRGNLGFSTERRRITISSHQYVLRNPPA